MLKNLAPICAASIVAAAAFSTSAQARGDGHSSGGRAHVGIAHHDGARVSHSYSGRYYNGTYRRRSSFVPYYGSYWWPHYGGGYYGGGYYYNPNYYIEPDADVSTSQPPGPVIMPFLGLSCRHSEEIVTVPSGNGGHRQIKIIRC